jgi:hypothetical protein
VEGSAGNMDSMWKVVQVVWTVCGRNFLFANLK